MKLRVEVNGVEVPGSGIPIPVTIIHGRSDLDAQPDAAECTLEWFDLATVPKLGDDVLLRLVTDDDQPQPVWDDERVTWADRRVQWGGLWHTWYRRFLGRVVDVEWQETLGQVVSARVTAVHRLAALGRRHVKMTRPQETDLARVAAIAAAAGYTITTIGHASPPLAAATIDDNALSALYEICASTGGLLWHEYGGSVRYGAADHRSLNPPVAVFTDSQIVDGLTWRSDVSTQINRVTLTYGPSESQAETTVTDTASISRYGTWETSVTTGLATQAAADELGNLILARRAWPFATLSDVLFDSHHMSTGDLGTLTSLQVGDTILLPIPPAPGPTGEPAEWIVEGWVEHWPDWDQFTLQLSVSDRARFALTTLRHWSHADDFTWAQEKARGSWLSTLILNPGEVSA